MGLDIYVYRLHKATEKNTKECQYFRLVDNDGNYNDRQFPDWALALKKTHAEDRYDWEKYKEQTGIDVNASTWRIRSYSTKGCHLKLYNKQTGDVITIDLEKVPLYTQPISIIGREEIGYQRKGLNDKFYKDYADGKIGYFVWTKKELERYKEEYCEDSYEQVYADGEKVIIDPKENFQKHIIDNFVEGECCVCFSW